MLACRACFFSASDDIITPVISLFHVDLIAMNANIHTVSSGRAQALAVREGIIVAVGHNEEIRRLAHSKTQMEDLQGKTVLPAFIDAHMHVVSTGLHETFYVDLSGCRSLSQALERVRERVEQTEKSRWVLGRGWDESFWAEKRYITRADLDKIAPEHPTVLIRIDGHILCANSLALKKITVTARADEYDETQGLLCEQTAWAFLQQLQPSDEQIQEAILAATARAHRLGVVAVHDIVKPAYVKAYSALHQNGQLRLRIYLNLEITCVEPFIEMGLRTGFGDEWLKLGATKFFADGSIGARNAALYQPYCNAEGMGKLNYEQAELNRLVKHVHRNGFQVMVHAIGDRAIDAALEAFTHAGPTSERRHRIEHAELLSHQQIARMKQMGIVASMQPNFVQWSGPGLLYETRLGPERDAHIDPHRDVTAAGVKLVFGSDGMPFNPLFGIHAAVNAPHEKQRLSVEEAIRAYTLNAAYAAFEEEVTGSLEPGKRADFIVLSEDPEKAIGKIKDTRIEKTYLGGEQVF